MLMFSVALTSLLPVGCEASNRGANGRKSDSHKIVNHQLKEKGRKSNDRRVAKSQLSGRKSNDYKIVNYRSDDRKSNNCRKAVDLEGSLDMRHYNDNVNELLKFFHIQENPNLQGHPDARMLKVCDYVRRSGIDMVSADCRKIRLIDGTELVMSDDASNRNDIITLHVAVFRAFIDHLDMLDPSRAQALRNAFPGLSARYPKRAGCDVNTFCCAPNDTVQVTRQDGDIGNIDKTIRDLPALLSNWGLAEYRVVAVYGDTEDQSMEDIVMGVSRCSIVEVAGDEYKKARAKVQNENGGQWEDLEKTVFFHVKGTALGFKRCAPYICMVDRRRTKDREETKRECFTMIPDGYIYKREGPYLICFDKRIVSEKITEEKIVDFFLKYIVNFWSTRYPHNKSICASYGPNRDYFFWAWYGNEI